MPVIVSYIQMMIKAKVTQFSENNGKAISRKDLTCCILLHAFKACKSNCGANEIAEVGEN